ncbi:beta strand repeat-containing protein, partial [Tolypothrix sp. VBCCA 56010]|uniref:beta strand repeat-containing protein n=1 Tax=Tolypothrix sp. VBCCA 56010 TaxID=3137731 RepID=UPI003D7D58BA
SGQITAFEHFLQYGQIEGRNPNIFFDTSYYLQQNPDIDAAVKSGQITAIEHFLEFGEKEGRNPGKFFDTSYYLQQNQDVAAVVKSGQITAIEHFLEFGEKEGRNAIASYDNKQYLKRYSDVADAVVKGQLPSAYKHFVVYGESVEKRFGVNTAPMAMDDTNSTIEGTAIKISVLANDTDFNKDTLSITNFTKAAKGEIVDNKDGTFTYTPNSGFTGSDSFDYQITDSYDGIATGKVNINVVQKPSVTLALTSNSVLENGNTGLAYTFTRSDVTDNALTVNFNVTGDAVFGGTDADYTQLGAATFASGSTSSSGIVPGIGTVMFKPGEGTATVTLTPVGDTLVESDETVALTLADGNNYTVGTATAVTGTITNDDTSVTLALASNTVLENSPTGLAYTFKRTGVINNELTVNFNIGGDALFGVTEADYTQSGAASFASELGTVTFGAGKDTATVTLTPTLDTNVESDEKVTLTLATGTNYTVGTTTPVTGTIKNDDTSVTLAVAPSDVLEDSGKGLVYTFSRTGVTDNDLTVNFGVEGTATFGSDYSQSGPTTFAATGGTVTFKADEKTKTVTLTPNKDDLAESDETIALTLTTDTGYTIGTANAVIGTIKNDEPEVTLAVTPNSVLEDSGANLVYTFTRSIVSDKALTVSFKVEGTAFADDYTQSGATISESGIGTVTFAPNQDKATVTLTPKADSLVEENETVALTLTNSAGTNYSIGTANAVTGTINNDDTSVTLAVSNDVFEDSNTDLVYTFTRAGVTDNALTVNFNVEEGATFGTDYKLSGAASFGVTNGKITFNPGEKTTTLRVTPVTDNVVEPDEKVILTLTDGTGYSIGSTKTAIGTIKNDEPEVTLTVTPNSVLEDSGTGLAYTFTRSIVSDKALTVSFKVEGTASADDYTQSGAASFESGVGTVTFAPNQDKATVTLTPKLDKVVEPDETVALTLTNSTNTGYSIGATKTATGTITNDDKPPTVSISAFNATASEEGTNGTYRISRGDANTTGDLAVNLTIDDTGTYKASANDYTLKVGNATLNNSNLTVTIADGQSYVDVTLAATDDVQAEADETLKLNLANGSAYNIDTTNNNANATATVTIAANDTVVTNTNDSVNDYTLREGSLRQALLNAIAFAGANTITFQLPTEPQTITLATALPTITGTNANDTTIDGGNAANLALIGNNNYIIFDVNAVNANFKNLTIANGTVGIYQSGGTMNVTGSIFSGNSAKRYPYSYYNSQTGKTEFGIYYSGGSAIHISSGTATVNSSSFSNNTMGDGAIYNNSTADKLTIRGSTFTNNSPASVYGNYTDGGGNTFNTSAQA